jgi:NADH:ubiquinone oxidoreductase subunit 2 (subunit N)
VVQAALEVQQNFASISLNSLRSAESATHSTSNIFAHNTHFLIFSKLLIACTAVVAVIIAMPYLLRHNRPVVELPFLLILIALFCVTLVSANHFVLVIIAVVGFSIASYALVFLDADRKSTRESGVKYYYLSAVSTSLLLCGVFFFLLVTQTGYLSEA